MIKGAILDLQLINTSLRLTQLVFFLYRFPHGVYEADVSSVTRALQWFGPQSELRAADGHGVIGQLQVQVPSLALDGGWKSRPWAPQAHVRSPGQPGRRRTLDVPSGDVSQAETDQQHLRQTRICE